MTRIPPVTRENATPEQLAAYDEVAKHHAISNMKAAALRSTPFLSGTSCTMP